MRDDIRLALRRRLGSNARRLRELHKLTQGGLAERMGKDQGRHVGQIERSEANVGLDVIAVLADGLGVDAQDLFAPIAIERSRRTSGFTRVRTKDLEVLWDALSVILRARFRFRR